MNKLKLQCNRFPGELKYKYSGQNVYFLDQLDTWDGINEAEYFDDPESWIWSRIFEDYLIRTYNLTGKEYLNLIITGDLNNTDWEVPDDKYYWMLYNSDYKNLYLSRVNLKCKISPGEILFTNIDNHKTFVDQLDSGEKIESSYFTKYILRKYALTPKEYYNIVIYDDIFHEELCPYCKIRSKKFYSLRSGYAETCSESKCFSEIHSDRSQEMWESKSQEDRDKVISALQSKCHEFESQCLASYNKFMNAGNMDDPAKFYLAISNEGLFKFGVCTDVRARVTRMKYKSIHILVSDTRYHVAELEYWIKFNMKLTNEYLDRSQLKEFNTQFRLMYDKIYNQHYLD